MIVSTFINYIRNIVQEESPTGFIKTAFATECVNAALSSRVIPDLYLIGKYIYMHDLVVSSDTLKPIIVTDERYDYFDLAGCASIPFRPSIRAWIDKIRVKFFDVDDVFEYEGDDYAFFRPQALGAIVGDHIRIYGVSAYKWYTVTYNTLVGTFTAGEIVTGATSTATGVIVSDTGTPPTGTLILKDVSGVLVNGEEIEGEDSGATANIAAIPVNCALDVEYIKIPTYVVGDTIELTLDVIYSLLAMATIWQVFLREGDMETSDKYLGYYQSNLALMKLESREVSNPKEVEENKPLEA